MKITLSTNQIVDALRDDEDAGWSYEGAKALAEYLNENEDENKEFDACEVRSEWSEYPSATEAFEDMGHLDYADHDEKAEYEAMGEYKREEEAAAFFEREAAIIRFNGGVIVRNY